MKRKGFTLIELVVVMAIIAVLAVLVVGAITVARNTAMVTANEGNAKNIQTGLEATFAQSNPKAYPVIAANTTFATAAGTLGVTMGGGSCANGGGIVTAAANSYTITIYKADCAATLRTISYP